MRTPLVLLLPLTVLLPACLTTKAATPVERPALEVPPVPPRVVEAPPQPELPQVEEVTRVPAEIAKPAASKPRPAPARETAKETAKPEPAKVEPPPPEPPPAAAPQTPPLRTAPTDAAAVDRKVRDILDRAEGMLKNVDYQRLSAQRRGAYEQAKANIDGARDALKGLNFELAADMADKAEKLAAGLLAR